LRIGIGQGLHESDFSKRSDEILITDERKGLDNFRERAGKSIRNGISGNRKEGLVFLHAYVHC
jgi:hypothetical protein